MLVVDDGLLVHDRVFPNHLHLPEEVALVGIFIVLSGFFLYYLRRILLTTDYLFLFLALLFFAISIAMDQRLLDTDLETFFEDGVKFLGIIFWLTYFYLTAEKAIHNQAVFK